VWYAAARPPNDFVALSYRADIVQSCCVYLARSASWCWRSLWSRWRRRRGRESEVAEVKVETRLENAMVEVMVAVEGMVLSI
jgi:hypothetical protein